MNFDDVEIKLCFQELTKIDLQLCAAIQDIRETSSFDELQRLNQDTRELVLDIKERLEGLEKLAHEQDKETDKVAILREVEICKKQLESSQQNLRKANLASKRALESRERTNLLDGVSTDNASKGKGTKKEMAKEASNVTESLMSLSRALAAQVQTSEFTNTTLAKSSNQITETQEEFKSMSGHIQNSRKLLTKYGRRELTDKLLIFLALVFFFSTVVYILKKRMFGIDVAQTAESFVNSRTSGSDLHGEL